MTRKFLKSLVDRTRSIFSENTMQRHPYLFTTLVGLLIFIFGINAFVELSADVKAELLTDFDESITSDVMGMRTVGLTTLLTFITEVGDVQGYVVIMLFIAVLFYIIFRKWKYVIRTLLILVLATVSNVLLKRAFDRARPDLDHLVSVKTLSYPSGHAMSSMAFYGFLIYLVYKYNLPIVVKVGLIIVLTFLIFSIGVSRIYLGVHYPSDVLGGWIAGGLWVVFCVLLFNLFDVYKKDPHA